MEPHPTRLDLERKCVAAWKVAGAVLEEQRKARLSQLPEEYGGRMLGAGQPPLEPFFSHGLARWQSWMLKWRLKETIRLLSESNSRAS